MESPVDLIHRVKRIGQRRGPVALNDAQRVIFLIAELESAIAMDGLYAYYDCPNGEMAMACAGALEQIGAWQAARLIRQANALFPNGVPPRDWQERQDQLFSLPEVAKERLDAIGERFLDYPDKLTEKLALYARRHADELQ